MTDTVSREKRSAIMAAVRSRDTKPEKFVRSLIHRLGYRFRLHRKDLPGRPDIVLPRHRAVVFVHGCFWHAHRCKAGDRLPATNTKFWRNKRNENVVRDRSAIGRLRRLGWRILVVWECETKDAMTITGKVKRFLK
jgi:DNA mismatch endonuclease (patch repair protein)